MYPTLSTNSYLKVTPISYIFSTDIPARFDMVINESAYEILKLCNGSYSHDKIAQMLCKSKNDDPKKISGFIEEFLTPLIQNKLIVDRQCPGNVITIVGDKETYYPDSIVWELTTGCPLKCRHCYQESKKTALMSRSDIDRILDIVQKYGVSNIQLTGGEFFTHPDANYVVDRLLDLNRNISISTSGFILNDDVKTCLSKIPNTGFVKISIDGDKDFHNFIRRNSQAYDKAITFIKYLADQGIACQVGTTLTNQSEESIKELVHKMRLLGVRVHNLGPVSVQGNAKSSGQHYKYNQGNVVSMLRKLSNEYNNDSFTVQVPAKMEEENCGCGYRMIRITPELDITPCPMLDVKMGNIHNQGYENIFKAMSSSYLNLSSPGRLSCMECDKKDLCGNCLADGMINCENNCSWYKNQNRYLKQIMGGW